MAHDIEPWLPVFIHLSSLSFVQIMRIFNYLLLVVLSKITGHEALHLRIYVPDVINRHLHTRTVVLHLHKPAPKKPKTHKKHEYHENWSSWSSYEQDNRFKDEHGGHELSEEREPRKEEPSVDQPLDDKNRRPKYFPVYDYHRDSYLPQLYVDDNDLEQKDRQRDRKPTYAVHEDVNDVPPNSEAFSYNYEEGYRKGLQEESGHVRADQTSKFHEDQHEELEDNENGGSKDEFEGKTDAGRYFVDDVEYENTRDKREGKGRRFRRINRL